MKNEKLRRREGGTRDTGTAGDATHASGGRWQSSQTPPARCFPWGAPGRTAGCEGTAPAGPPPAAPASASLGRWRTPSTPPAGLGARGSTEGKEEGNGRLEEEGEGGPRVGQDPAAPSRSDQPPPPGVTNPPVPTTTAPARRHKAQTLTCRRTPASRAQPAPPTSAPLPRSAYLGPRLPRGYWLATARRAEAPGTVPGANMAVAVGAVRAGLSYPNA